MTIVRAEIRESPCFFARKNQAISTLYGNVWKIVL